VCTLAAFIIPVGMQVAIAFAQRKFSSLYEIDSVHLYFGVSIATGLIMIVSSWVCFRNREIL
jgi:hypothetical protein